MVKIGLVQMRVALHDVERNIEISKGYLKEAYDSEMDIVAFPELFLTGRGIFSYGDKFVDTIPGKFTDTFSKFAEEYGVHIVMGSIIEKSGDVYYNTSVLIDDKGKIIGKYLKNKPWVTELKYSKPGTERPVFNTKYGKIGIMICNDLSFPEVSRDLALKGADIIFVPTAWAHEDRFGLLKSSDNIPSVSYEDKIINSLVTARASENNTAIAFVNFVGEQTIKGVKYVGAGQTQIALPIYGAVYHMGNEEGLLKGEVDLNIMKVAEEAYLFKTMSDKKMNNVISG